MPGPAEAAVRRRGLSGVVLGLLGCRVREIALVETGLRLAGGRPRDVAFADLAGAPRVGRGLWSTAVVVPLRGGGVLRCVGVRRAEAEGFLAAATEAWRGYVADELTKAEAELRRLADIVRSLDRPEFHPAACLLEPVRARGERLLALLAEALPEGALSAEVRKRRDVVAAFLASPDAVRDRAVEAFVESELEREKDFLDTVESNPLTPEQRLAVVTDEDATLVLAGAGSGKTSVIVAKAAHLIRRGFRKPEEILLMAFGREAAAEMATRIRERTGAEVDAMTFHALGYAIIRAVEGGAPALAPHATDEARYRALLRDILVRDVAPRTGLGRLLVKWFADFGRPYRSEWDFKTKDEYYRYVEAQELRTLKGELVKSFEELEIANWLHVNGIAYEYEPDYEHPLPENDRTAYTPDFRLTESGVYIEHFGVRKARGRDGSERLVTAPFVDRESYLEGMAWKRRVHETHGTVLVETYSYERVEGRLTEALEEKLAPYVTPNPIPTDAILDDLAEKGRVDPFTQTLGVFLRHFKSSGRSLDECRARAEAFEDRARGRAFLRIFEPVLEAYRRRLGERIDFEDMIARATEHVESGRYRSPYRHLLVDEFQDISEGRARLLRALKAQHFDARIYAVGDDWQSIYRFTGADIHLMRRFGEAFGGRFAGRTGVHATVDLGRTFRSVDRIALPARRFVLRNPSQIEKRVVPRASTEAPAIRVAMHDRPGERAALIDALDAIRAEAVGEAASVLLLGRYNFLRPADMRGLATRYPEFDLRFMTVHASKGLEADHVVILRAAAGRMGFPSEIVDDPLLDLVLPEPERFDFAEERRLFYVALTRARTSVTLLADRERPSAFARELLDDPEYEALGVGEAGAGRRRCPACGGRMLSQVSRSGGAWFACEHRRLCGHRLRACSACGSDLPVRSEEDPDLLVCRCGATFPACPRCEDGWLVERTGRYGRFLGCVNYPDCRGKGSGPAPEPRGPSRARTQGGRRS